MSSIPSTKSSQRIWCLVLSCYYLLLRLFKWWNVWNKIWGWRILPLCRMNTVVQQPWGETQERSCEIFPGSSLIWECLDGCLILLTQMIVILLGPPLGLLLNPQNSREVTAVKRQQSLTRQFKGEKGLQVINITHFGWFHLPFVRILSLSLFGVLAQMREQQWNTDLNCFRRKCKKSCYDKLTVRKVYF